MRFVVALLALSAQAGTLDPNIQQIVKDVSEERVAATLRKLTSFGTRGNFNPKIVEARQWIASEFKSYDPRLQVSFDAYKVKKQGSRILRDVDVVNVVAVLPGTTQASERIIVGGHYDSFAIVRKPGSSEFAPDGSEAAVDDYNDFEKSVAAPAPGASDDASGTAVVMELARVMSKYRFEKTIVFVAFAGEEIGLIGSTLYADKAQQARDHIEAMLNNDVVGDGRGVNVFSDDPVDSPSRELARYIRDTALTYVPWFPVNAVFRADRFMRGGDHTPFSLNGYAAVRFTTPAENLVAEHTSGDTLDKTSAAYTANVARVNGAAVANLALAPPPPNVAREILTGARKGTTQPNLSRGKSKYDAVLRWKDPNPVADLAGYTVVMRSTTAPFWEHEVFVGKVSEYTLPQYSIDDVVLGVKAVDTGGHESLVSPYVNPLWPVRPVELVQ